MAASSPDIVGARCFQYASQPRLLDGENSRLVGITDIPFTGFVDAVHTANRVVSH